MRAETMWQCTGCDGQHTENQIYSPAQKHKRLSFNMSLKNGDQTIDFKCTTDAYLKNNLAGEMIEDLSTPTVSIDTLSLSENGHKQIMGKDLTDAWRKTVKSAIQDNLRIYMEDGKVTLGVNAFPPGGFKLEAPLEPEAPVVNHLHTDSPANTLEQPRRHR